MRNLSEKTSKQAPQDFKKNMLKYFDMIRKTGAPEPIVKKNGERDRSGQEEGTPVKVLFRKLIQANNQISKKYKSSAVELFLRKELRTTLMPDRSTNLILTQTTDMKQQSNHSGQHLKSHQSNEKGKEGGAEEPPKDTIRGDVSGAASKQGNSSFQLNESFGLSSFNAEKRDIGYQDNNEEMLSRAAVQFHDVITPIGIKKRANFVKSSKGKRAFYHSMKESRQNPSFLTSHMQLAE